MTSGGCECLILLRSDQIFVWYVNIHNIRLEEWCLCQNQHCVCCVALGSQYLTCWWPVVCLCESVGLWFYFSPICEGCNSLRMLFVKGNRVIVYSQCLCPGNGRPSVPCNASSGVTKTNTTSPNHSVAQQLSLKAACVESLFGCFGLVIELQNVCFGDDVLSCHSQSKELFIPTPNKKVWRESSISLVCIFRNRLCISMWIVSTFGSSVLYMDNIREPDRFGCMSFSGIMCACCCLTWNLL